MEEIEYTNMYCINVEDKNSTDNITTDVIQNRYDINNSADNWRVIHYQSSDENIWFEILILAKSIELGLQLVPISDLAFERIIRFLFRKFRKINFITYQNSYYSRRGGNYNYFTISLPKNVQELDEITTSKSRYNLRRSYNLLEKTVGKCHFDEYSVCSEESKRLLEFFFTSKKEGYGTDYNMSTELYIEKYKLSNIYAIITENNRNYSEPPIAR